MKLWEVIKELTDDPTKIFVAETGLRLGFCRDVVCLWKMEHRKDAVGMYTYNESLDTDSWQEVKYEYAPPMRALNALTHGRPIKVVYEGENHYIFPRELKDLKISPEFIICGEWFVEIEY